ncbi:MAG: DUF1566 domain-containing protein [Bacteroidia bacterium]|nr:DUF1566 domain-containing protein [Bacteroidia bacterium]
MKKIITVCAVLLMTASVFAQAPEKMSYQAVVRDGSNALVSSTAVGMQISILQGSASGTAVYVETQTPTSNANGLVSLEIGAGTVVSGTFNTIDWANGPYFIKTETDPTGGTSYTITSTSQLLSVPYALHAKTAESVTGGSSNDFYLGQDTLGGIVFYIYIGSDGNQHGLIVNKNESSAQWQISSTTTNATRSWDGAYNTGLMTSSPAANYVNGLTDGGFTDWYLPSIDELSILWHNRFHANNALNAGGFTLLSNTAAYWSSTENLAPNAFAFTFGLGYAATSGKANTYSVRAVRAF